MTTTLTETHPQTTGTPVENRVVGSGGFTASITPVTWSQVVETHQETFDTSAWIVSEVGRWLSKDPIGINGGLNQYVAFGNNGVNFVDPDGLLVTIATRSIIGGAGNHSFIDVTDSSGVTLYSGTNEPGNQNDLGVRKNYLPDVNAKVNSRVIVPPPPHMTQAQWDAAVRSSGEAALKKHMTRAYDAFGGDRGKTSGNCHVVTKEIIGGAGGSIPAGYNPPGANPGLHR
jgi:uncharacterized protein RhaS with RHS repeats